MSGASGQVADESPCRRFSPTSVRSFQYFIIGWPACASSTMRGCQKGAFESLSLVSWNQTGW